MPCECLSPNTATGSYVADTNGVNFTETQNPVPAPIGEDVATADPPTHHTLNPENGWACRSFTSAPSVYDDLRDLGSRYPSYPLPDWYYDLQRKHAEMLKKRKDEEAFKIITEETTKDDDTVVFDSGAKRSNDVDNIRFDLIPPLAEERVARVLATGGKKYGEHNWRKGTDFSVCLKHLMAHINKYRRGDRSVDHLAHATCNLLFLMEYEAIHPELNDLLQAADFLPAVCVTNTEGVE